MDRQEELDRLVKILSNSSNKAVKDKMKSIFDLLDKLGAKSSLQALREIDAARKVFDLVCRIEYTGLAVQAFTQMKDQKMMEKHVDELNEMLRDFQPDILEIMNEAKINVTMEGGLMLGPKTNIALQSAFHYYERACAWVKQLDNQNEYQMCDLGLIIRQVEAFAEFQLNCYGYKTHGDILPSNMAEHIHSMQELN